MNKRIAVIYGDGIGPEVAGSAVEVLKAVADKFGHTFEFVEAPAGGAAIDQFGEPLPAASLETCRSADAVLLGAVGGPKWDTLPGHLRPEKGLLALRQGLELFANLRPALLFSQLREASPLKESLIGDGIDFIVVRELTGDIYYGKRGRDGDDAYDTMSYSRYEIERVGRVAFELARSRKKRLCSIDKANVLDCSRMWRETMHTLSEEFSDVEYSDMLVDNAAMQLVKNPRQFDVIVTGNMFGDILSDEAAQITGSIGMLPSSSMGSGTFGLYEPIHGSAPDIAGKDIANPLGTVLSAAMLLRTSLGLEKEAAAVEAAVTAVLDAGLRTADIAAGGLAIGTKAMTKAILERLA